MSIENRDGQVPTVAAHVRWGARLEQAVFESRWFPFGREPFSNRVETMVDFQTPKVSVEFKPT